MKLPSLKQVRQVRLLPVVIFAAVALLLLKGVGIMSGGGYVLLTGVEVAQAAGGGGHDEAAAEDRGATMETPSELTMTDDSPVLDDDSPTLPLSGETGEDAGHGATDAEVSHNGSPADGGGGHAGAAAEGAPGQDPEVAQVPCIVAKPEAESAPAVDHGQADQMEGFDFITETENCIVDPGVSAAGDALPVIKDGAGNILQMVTADGRGSEVQIIERLSVRRAELEQREAELEMRMALVEAAEKRIDERTAALEALEARINAMVDEKRTLEEAQFVGVVAMYETMKPKDAAAIFDQLDMPVLLRVARAVNPRKMAPIMAKMDPLKATELTAGLAVDQVEPTIEMGPSGSVAELPQIIGQ